MYYSCVYRDDSLRAKTLAVAIRNARDKKGYSREVLARAVDVSSETIRKIEEATTASPGVFLIADLARALDLKLINLVKKTKKRKR